MNWRLGNYQTGISNIFAALEKNYGENITRAREYNEENIKTSAKDSLDLHELN